VSQALELLPYAIAMAGTGVLGGLLAGLLGVGGGIIVVPVLHQILVMLGFDPAVAMHASVGTSLATIVPTSIVSARSHWKRANIDVALTRSWAPFIVTGALGGTVLAAFVSGRALAGVFGVIALAVGLWMALNRTQKAVFGGVPTGAGRIAAGGGIGLFATMMGIGGGTLSVPVLSACGYPIRRAVGTGALWGLFISVPGTIGFALSGLGVEGRPPLSLGYVNIPGFVLVVPLSMLMAPWGARIAHAIPPRALQLCFATFLVITAVKFAMVAF
jgi:uncharacterized membrane protein YfcA